MHWGGENDIPRMGMSKSAFYRRVGNSNEVAPKNVQLL